MTGAVSPQLSETVMTRLPRHSSRPSCLGKVLTGAALLTILAVPSALAHPVPDDPASVHFLANEAVLVTAGETRILFDPLFSISYGYPLIAPDVRARIMAGMAPYDSIDVILVSHVHGDHFDPADVNTYLGTHSEVILVAPWQALLDLRDAAGWQDGFEARIRALPFIAAPQETILAADGIDDAIRIESLYIPHAGGPGQAGIQNMAHRVTLMGETTVMHLGDATPEPAIYETQSAHFQARRSHHAFPPYWLIGQWGVETVRKRLNAGAVTGIHLPIGGPDGLDVSGGDYFTIPGETRSIAIPSHD